jgi:hypothetical protein
MGVLGARITNSPPGEAIYQILSICVHKLGRYNTLFILHKNNIGSILHKDNIGQRTVFSTFNISATI